MQTKEYMVGQTYPELKSRNDIAKADMDDSGMVAFIGFDRPTAKEKRNFNSREPVQVRFVQIEGILFLLLRFGTLNWMDFPFNVNLAPNLTAIPDIHDGMGMNLTVLFFDTHSGKMLSIRSIGLPTDLSRKLVEIMKEEKNDSFDRNDYNRRISAIQSRYSTDDLVKKSQEELRSNREDKYHGDIRKDKKAEALVRMKKMRIAPEIIRKFTEQGIVSISMSPNGVFSQLSDEDMKRIRQFEAKYGVLVYMVVRSDTCFGMVDCYLFISNYPEEWGIERDDLAYERNWRHVAYVYNHDMPDWSETGLIGLAPTPAAGLQRTW